jgi:hypothetical protein
MSEFEKFDEAMGTILKADSTRVKAQMEADRKSDAEVKEDKRHEAAMDKLGKKTAAAMQGHVRVIGGARSQAIVSAFNEEMKKQRLRKVN